VAAVVHLGQVAQLAAAQAAAARQVHRAVVVMVIQQLVQIPALVVVVEMEIQLEVVTAQQDW
jgi:hypothetical protein